MAESRSMRPRRPPALRRLLLGLAAAGGLAMPAARAELVDIAWGAGGGFDRRLSLAPGAFAELCGRLDKGQRVQWKFEASQGLDFNLHFHVGKRVHTPTRASQTRKMSGLLAAESAQDYCWMWTNPSAAAADLSAELLRL